MLPQWLKPFFAAAFLGTGVATAEAADSIIASVGGTNYSDSHASFGGSIGILHATEHWGVSAGTSDTQYAMGKLGVVDFDAYSLSMPRLTLSAGASVGSATTSAGSNTLIKTRLALESPLRPEWIVRCSDQFIELAQIRGHLFAAGVEYMPVPRFGIRLSGGYSISGTLADRYADAAFHWYGALHLFGGVVAGRTGYDPSRLGQDTIIRHLVQVYTGASIPIRHGTLTLSLDNTNLAGEPRQSLRVGFIEPIS